MSPLLTIANCIAIRLATLIRKRLLLYKNIQFQVFSPCLKGKLLRVAITLNLKHIKRSSRKSKR
jgi:hypothetical protein